MNSKLTNLLGLAMALGLLAGCGSRQGEATVQREPQEAVLIPVQAAYPERGDISAHFETTTRVEAERRVEVLSKGSGVALEVSAEEGETVAAGAVLVRLEREELEAQVRQSRVSVEQHRTQLAIAKRSFDEGIGSKVEWDNARFAYEQARATLAVQEVQLANQDIVAPIGGVVTMRNVQRGQFVAAGTPIMVIVDPESYVLPINPPERELGRLRIEQTARVTIDSVRGQDFRAAIRRINPSVDPLSGTVRVLLDFDGAARPHLREGAFARVRLVMDTHENVLKVPKDAIIEENARKYVMVVREQDSPHAEAAIGAELAGAPPETPPVKVARRVEIVTGLEDSTHVEVISGLDDHDRIVTLGQHTLREGSPVRITTAEREIESSAEISVDEALSNAQDRREQGRRT